jgi:hypothetical protein
MSSFTSPLIVEKIGERLWKTYRELIYYVGEENSADIIIVPVGFQTDFASIPSLFWMVLPPDGGYTAAAVIHDFLYFAQTRTRLASDRIFLEAMKILKVNIFKRLIMYRAVRTFSWISWNRHTDRMRKPTEIK